MAAAETAGIAPELRRSAGWVVALGIIQIIVGMMAILSPYVVGVVFAYFIGAALVVGGALEMVYAARAASWGGAVLSVVVGLFAIVAGAIVIAHPIFGLKFLTLLLIIYFAADGVARMILAFAVRPPGWGWDVFVGIVSLVLAILIWRAWGATDPETGQRAAVATWLIGTLVGIQILFMGFTHVAVGTAARKAIDAPGG